MSQSILMVVCPSVRLFLEEMIISSFALLPTPRNDKIRYILYPQIYSVILLRLQLIRSNNKEDELQSVSPSTLFSGVRVDGLKRTVWIQSAKYRPSEVPVIPYAHHCLSSSNFHDYVSKKTSLCERSASISGLLLKQTSTVLYFFDMG